LAIQGSVTGTLTGSSSLFGYGVSRSGNQLLLTATSANFTPAAYGLPQSRAAEAGQLQDIWDHGGTPALSSLFALRGNTASQDSGNGVTSYKRDRLLWQIGGQTEIAPNWFLGGSLAYEQSWLSSGDSLTTGNGQQSYGAAILKYQTGPWLFAASAFGGAGQFNASRMITLPGYTSVAKGSSDTANLGLLLRAAYTIGREEFYLRPNLSLATVQVRTGAYQEGGGGALDLSVERASQTTLVATPMLEVGSRIALRDDILLRPYVAVGANVLSTNAWKQTGRLISAPAGTGLFATSVPTDQVAARISADVQMFAGRQMDFRLQYDGEFSGTVSSDAGSLVAALRF
jgi:outer membrane autotransporter protein